MIIDIVFGIIIALLIASDIYIVYSTRIYAKYNNHIRNDNHNFLHGEIRRIDRRLQQRLLALEELYIANQKEIYSLNSKLTNIKHEIH